MRLANKVALVTGAGSGIGRATALLFAAEGARVVVNDRAVNTGEETVQMIKKAGGQAVFAAGDASVAADGETAVKKTLVTFGGINILVNNVGGMVGVKGALGDTSEDQWDSVIKNNVKSTFFMCHQVLPLMIKAGGGAIVNMGSQFGVVSVPLTAAYATAKAAVVHMTRQMALDYGRYNIRVNCLCPGPIMTEGHERFLRSSGSYEKAVADRKRATALGRMGRAEDVAYCALFLASDESAYVTGHALVVDGGYDARLCAD